MAGTTTGAGRANRPEMREGLRADEDGRTGKMGNGRRRSEKQSERTGALLPLLYVLIPAAGLGAAALIWGRDLRNLLDAAIKLVVKA